MKYLYYQIKVGVDLLDYELETSILLFKYKETNPVLLTLNMIYFVFSFYQSSKICFLAVLEMEPRASHKLDKCSTTEPQPRPLVLYVLKE